MRRTDLKHHHQGSIQAQIVSLDHLSLGQILRNDATLYCLILAHAMPCTIEHLSFERRFDLIELLGAKRSKLDHFMMRGNLLLKLVYPFRRSAAGLLGGTKLLLTLGALRILL